MEQLAVNTLLEHLVCHQIMLLLAPESAVSRGAPDAVLFVIDEAEALALPLCIFGSAFVTQGAQKHI